jgi:hypothetical protein
VAEVPGNLHAVFAFLGWVTGFPVPPRSLASEPQLVGLPFRIIAAALQLFESGIYVRRYVVAFA